MGTDYRQESYEETIQHFSNKLLAEKLEKQINGKLPFEEVLEIKEAARRLRHMRSVPKS
jgi:hypothetical protein